jgi:MoxR-like ATPase
MEERQVTLGDATHALGEPFMVCATQNPIEHEGTYPLAEAQVDRFMLKLRLDYPSRVHELEILDRMLIEHDIDVAPVADVQQLALLRQSSDSIRLDKKLRLYILDVVGATREPRRSSFEPIRDLVAFGASPRATLYLARAAKALALLRGRDYALPEDVKELAPDVLRHRIVPTYEAEAEGITSDEITRRILDRLPVP